MNETTSLRRGERQIIDLDASTMTEPEMDRHVAWSAANTVSVNDSSSGRPSDLVIMIPRPGFF